MLQSLLYKKCCLQKKKKGEKENKIQENKIYNISQLGMYKL